ncbi:hypothetical protein F4604DRAFT_1570620, partial [Suillus subluteus]
SVSLMSTRANTHSSGMTVVKLGVIAPPGAQSLMAFERVFAGPIKRSRLSLVSSYTSYVFLLPFSFNSFISHRQKVSAPCDLI